MIAEAELVTSELEGHAPGAEPEPRVEQLAYRMYCKLHSVISAYVPRCMFMHNGVARMHIAVDDDRALAPTLRELLGVENLAVRHWPLIGEARELIGLGSYNPCAAVELADAPGALRPDPAGSALYDLGRWAAMIALNRGLRPDSPQPWFAKLGVYVRNNLHWMEMPAGRGVCLDGWAPLRAYRYIREHANDKLRDNDYYLQAVKSDECAKLLANSPWYGKALGFRGFLRPVRPPDAAAVPDMVCNDKYPDEIEAKLVQSGELDPAAVILHAANVSFGTRFRSLEDLRNSRRVLWCPLESANPFTEPDKLLLFWVSRNREWVVNAGEDVPQYARDQVFRFAAKVEWLAVRWLQRHRPGSVMLPEERLASVMAGNGDPVQPRLALAAPRPDKRKPRTAALAAISGAVPRLSNGETITLPAPDFNLFSVDYTRPLPFEACPPPPLVRRGRGGPQPSLKNWEKYLRPTLVWGMADDQDVFAEAKYRMKRPHQDWCSIADVCLEVKTRKLHISLVRNWLMRLRTMLERDTGDLKMEFVGELALGGSRHLKELFSALNREAVKRRKRDFDGRTSFPKAKNGQISSVVPKRQYYAILGSWRNLLQILEWGLRTMHAIQTRQQS
jgi:hypothetical protein